MPSLLACALTALLAIFFAGAAPAHEGHDHPAQPAPAAVAAPRGEAASDAFELVAVVQGTDLVIYLDRFASNEPVTGAGVEVETPAGPARAEQTGDSYRLHAPWLSKPGRVELLVTVVAGDLSDVLPLSLDVPLQSVGASSGSAPSSAGMLRWLQPVTLLALGIGFAAGAGVMLLGRRRRTTPAALVLAVIVALGGAHQAAAHDGDDHSSKQAAPLPGGDRAQRLPDGSVFVPKPIQRIFGIRTVVTERAIHRRTTELPGRVIPDPNASGYVQAATAGRLSPPAGGFPRLGTPVRQGDVLAYLTPPLQAIDVSDMRQRQGELDQQISIVERRLARFEMLVPAGAVSRTQLEDTKLELEGLKVRRASLDQVRREPEALIAPVNGIVAEGTPVAGQTAQPNAIIFHIADPARLWVEALSFDAIAGPSGASAVAANGKTLKLAFRGSGFASRNQSIPVHFSIDDNVEGLRAGQFVVVRVTTGDTKEGVSVARSAVVRAANGQDFVYEHIGAERFEPRPVRIEPLDGDHVLVAAGLEPGRRVVTQGAELLDHVR